MLTVPWLMTSYIKALYGANASPSMCEDSKISVASCVGVEPEIRSPTQHQELRRHQIQTPQKKTQQHQLKESLTGSQASQQTAPPPKQSKLPVSANIISTRSAAAVPVTSKPAPVQPQIAQKDAQGEPPRQEENATLTSTKTLILKPSISGGRMSHEWVEKQVEQFQFTFDEADKDKSGSLTFPEIYGVLQAQGFKGSEEEAKFIFKDLDRDRNKSISRVEFTAAIKKLPKLSIKEFCLRKMFKAMDKDESGYLTKAEIAAASDKEKVGMDISDKRIAEILAAHSKDDNAKVDYEEFLQIFGFEVAASVVHQMFTKLDADGSGFLTRDELLDAVKVESGQELSTAFADKISDLVIHLVTDADKKISYEEFSKIWIKARQQKKK